MPDCTGKPEDVRQHQDRMDGPDLEPGDWLHQDFARMQELLHVPGVPQTRKDECAGLCWRDAEWVWCRDGKWRPVERATQSLLEQIPDGFATELGFMRLASGETIFSPLIEKSCNRIGRLRAYGNAIVAQVATVFIETYMESFRETDSQASLS